MPQAPRQRKRHATKVSLVTSLVFHGGIIAALAFFAAREGYLGKQLKTIAVTMAPKEKPPEPEKPKEPEKKPEPAPEKPKAEEPPPQQAVATPPPATTTTPPPGLAAPPAAPPPGQIAGFNFSDGAKAVETSSDPVQLYRSFLEYTLRSRWQRPEGIEDAAFVAEVELRVGRQGEVLGSRWLKGSGNTAWDQSVRRALDTTPRIDRVPPKGFPETVRVRFDVVQEADADAIAVP